MTTTTKTQSHWFASSLFARFMNSTVGRVARIVGGLGLIAGGILAIGGAVGVAVAAVGLVPLLAGTFDLCVFSKLFGGPLRGPDVRACARD